MSQFNLIISKTRDFDREKCLILTRLSKIAGNFKDESFYGKKDIPKVSQSEVVLSRSNKRLNICFQYSAMYNVI